MENEINTPSVKVISSHYAEDLSWIQFIKYQTVVYSKTIKDKNFINFNKVQEAPAYLKYIIDHYYELPDYTIFVHGHLYSEHQREKNIVDIINNISFTEDIINLNRPDWENSITFGEDKWDKKYSWLSDNWEDIFGDYLQIPLKMTFHSSAQFAVHKKCILQYPIEFWKKLYSWCENTNIDNYVSSRIFEYCWYYIFSKKALFL